MGPAGSAWFWLVIMRVVYARRGSGGGGEDLVGDFVHAALRNPRRHVQPAGLLAGGDSVGDESGDDVGVFERDRVGVELFDEPGEDEFGSAGGAASWEVHAKTEGFFEFVGWADRQSDSGQVPVVAPDRVPGGVNDLRCGPQVRRVGAEGDSGVGERSDEPRGVIVTVASRDTVAGDVGSDPWLKRNDDRLLGESLGCG